MHCVTQRRCDNHRRHRQRLHRARHWLKDLVPAFAEPLMGIVQAPQVIATSQDNAFKAMCYAEYRGFFHIGMITRNERNAIIQHGTMTLVRRKVLEEVGGWAEWCITEDAELGLRVFELGYDATYLPDSYGRGVMPDTFIDFKKQRFLGVRCDANFATTYAHFFCDNTTHRRTTISRIAVGCVDAMD